MKVYQISYDLRKQRNYEPLYERIRSYSSWCHALESSWLVVTTQNATAVRDHLAAALDGDDGLLVTRVTSEAAWRGLGSKVSEWLKSQLSQATA